MIIDKLDQNATYLPTVRQMARTSFFKEGARLQMSMIGAWWGGTSRSPELSVRSVFEDLPKHGANMQASTILLNLHDRVMQEGDLPEEFFINADNTSKETKNNQCMHFFIWLLINLEDTKLWSITLLFLLVGHTHNKLGRFFSRVKMALAGMSYFTREQTNKILADRLKGFKVDLQHVSDS